jgi:hypothetical protein
MGVRAEREDEQEGPGGGSSSARSKPSSPSQDGDWAVSWALAAFITLSMSFTLPLCCAARN